MKAFSAAIASAAILVVALPIASAQSGSTATAPALPSAQLSPALNRLGRNLNDVHPERWKLNAAARDQTVTDLESIHHDLETTLPPLLNAADATPALVSTQLLVSRNVTALYDVLLRLVERGRPAAPQDQEALLEQARQTLDTARRAFDQNLQTVASTQETTLKLLQTAPPPAPPPPPPPPAPKKKSRTKAKPAPSSN